MDGLLDEQPIRPTSTHQRNTHHPSYPLIDGYFLGYQNNLTLLVLRMVTHIINGHHSATVTLTGLAEFVNAIKDA
jgi:hypothetical protein